MYKIGDKVNYVDYINYKFYDNRTILNIDKSEFNEVMYLLRLVRGKRVWVYHDEVKLTEQQIRKNKIIKILSKTI